MNSQLANYLFNQEIIYKNPLPLAEEKKIESTESQLIKNIEIEKKEKLSQIKTDEKIQVKETPAYIYKSSIVVLVDTISDTEKALLSKILVAIGTSVEAIDLIELSKVQSLDYQLFVAQNKTKQFISFGVGLSKINWNIMLQPYQPKRVENVNFLLADKLSAIDADLPLKKVLWGGLKVMFT